MQHRILRTTGLIGIVALLLAAGGATAAQLTTGAQIKNESVTGKDIKNRSLTPADFRGSVQGPQGVPGPRGERDPQGPGGPQGAAGTTNTKFYAGTDGDDGKDTVFCGPGERVVGGGAFSPNPDAYLSESSPVEEGANFHHGWTATASVPGNGPAAVEVYVICAAP